MARFVLPLALLLACALPAPVAVAQINLPDLDLPDLDLPVVDDLVDGLVDGVEGAVGGAVDGVEEAVGGVVGGVEGAVGGAVRGVEGAVGGAGRGAAGGGASAAGQILDQAAALQAVRDNRALPLDRLLTLAAGFLAGDVIDVRLVVRQSLLLYEVKIVNALGMVTNLYFDARTAQPVLVRR